MKVVETAATPDNLASEFTPNQPLLLVGPPGYWEATGVDARIESAGWTSTHASDLDRACWLASIQKLSLVLVAAEGDTMWALVDALRPLTTAPLVVATATSSSTVVSLVNAGVDAVVDPRSGPDEVFARVVALLRRSDHGWAPGVRFLRAGNRLVVDLRSRECFLDGAPLALSPTEYALLTFLMTHPQTALSSDTIVRQVWGWYTSDGKNALRIFVNRVRRKLGDDSRDPEFVASVRGTGYRFIRNVTQLGDDAEPLADRPEGTRSVSERTVGLLRSVEDLSLALQRCEHTEAATERLFDALDASGYVDAMAVFRLDARTAQMLLVGARKMSERWMVSVAAGVPLTPAFASAHSVLIGEPVQFGDIRQMAQPFSATARELADSGFRACLFLPIGCGDRVWGHLGVARRTPEPFEATGSAYLRAACAVFALRVEALDSTVER